MIKICSIELFVIPIRTPFKLSTGRSRSWCCVTALLASLGPFPATGRKTLFLGFVGHHGYGAIRRPPDLSLSRYAWLSTSTQVTTSGCSTRPRPPWRVTWDRSGRAALVARRWPDRTPPVAHPPAWPDVRACNPHIVVCFLRSLWIRNAHVCFTPLVGLFDLYTLHRLRHHCLTLSILAPVQHRLPSFCFSPRGSLLSYCPYLRAYFRHAITCFVHPGCLQYL